MTDYRLRLTVRNARLLRAIEKAGHRPGPAFAAAVGIGYSGVLWPYLNLTRSPVDRSGLLRECAWALCDFLRASPSELWSAAQIQQLARNHVSIDVDAEQLEALLSGSATADDPVRLASRAEVGRLLRQSIDRLTPREAEVIQGRFFSEATLAELSQELGITPEHVRRHERSALQKLREWHAHSTDLKGVADFIRGTADA